MRNFQIILLSLLSVSCGITQDATYELSQSSARIQNIFYDYTRSAQSSEESALNIYFELSNSKIPRNEGSIAIRGTLFDLSNSSQSSPFMEKLNFTQNGNAFIKIANLHSAHVYRLELSVWQTGEGSEENLGRIYPDFYGVTSGLTPLEQTRAAMTYQALSEWNDWELGRAANKPYVVGAWCDLFYRWLAEKFLDRNYRSNWKRSSVASLRELALAGVAVHGNYLRREGSGRSYGHTGMVLAYDQATGKMVTIEGNYNNRVLIGVRSLTEFAWMGNLTPEVVKR